MTFRSILETAQARNNSTLAIGIAPKVEALPESIQRFDDPFLPYSKAVIDATSELVCAYVFHMAEFLTLGAAGAVALERAIAYVPVHIVKILHGPFASPEYAQVAFEGAFGADAVTLASTTSPDMIGPFVQHAYHGVFVECKPDTNVQPFLRLNEDYPGQVGIYRPKAAQQNTFGVFFEPYPQIEWRWDEGVYVSHDEGFRDAIHEAVVKLKRTPDES
jgi:hypothetical protein